LLSNIKIVLVETSHSGNIGAVARAMKNMMLTNLCLVSPKIFPHADATARAAGADDILARAQIFETLPEAIADCTLVIGASARSRTISWSEVTPRECAEKISREFGDEKIAILFGRENSGLKNEELDLCRFLLHIPCNPNYSSLNIAAAVQVVCYELFIAAQNGETTRKIVGDEDEQELATSQQMELFYEHLEQALIDIDFMRIDKEKSLMRRLRRIYNRAELRSKEVDILRGILRLSQGHKGQLKNVSS
jgi:tRNA (cytidine32/uridine32-2'-O)-methyltransferase